MANALEGTLYITGDPAADELLNTDGTALLIGMLLDQQVPMEWAFTGPATLRQRLGHLDAATIAAMDRDEFVAVCRAKPAIHRFPASMGTTDPRPVLHPRGGLRRVRDERVGGAATGDDLYARLRSLPGYGDEKSRIFIAILGKRMGVRPPGWQQAAGVFGDATPRSVADIDSPATLAVVREWKRAAKAAVASEQDRPIA